jgi:putative heme iron utilization protein
MEPKSVLRDTDAAAIAQARGLVRSARHGALAVLDPGTGTPLASRVACATDLSGAPVILISRLSAHFGALQADPRCSVLLGEPGRGDPLAHPRITVTCTAAMLDGTARRQARDRFLRRHPKSALYADFPDFAFWRLAPVAASLNGGFGKAYALTADQLATAVPDGLATLEPEAVAHMNADHAEAVGLYATMHLNRPAGDWRLTGIDADGLDLALGDDTARLAFDPVLTDAAQLQAKLVLLAKRAREMAARQSA